MAGAYLGSLVVAGTTLAIFGTSQGAIRLALQATARWSYCFFLLAYAGGSLTAVFGPGFRPVARRGRDLGLAFASAQFTHACLVAWLYYISPKPPVSTHAAIFFGTALFITYLLALFSIPSLAATLPPRLWRALRTFGMEFIAFAFLYDFAYTRFVDTLIHIAAYMPFVALGSAAALVRIAAYYKKVRSKSSQPAPPRIGAGSRLADR
jgi:hypothetical protein